MILITHIVFHYILYPDFRKNPEFKMDYGIFAAHYIVPLGMLADYILFDEKGHFNYSNVFLWVFIPVLFIPFAYTKTYVSGMFDKHFQHKYPYFFMDYEKLGVKTVVLIISVIIVFFVLFAYLFVFIDKLLGKIKKTKIE